MMRRCLLFLALAPLAGSVLHADVRLDRVRQRNTFGAVQDGLVITSGSLTASHTFKTRGFLRLVDVAVPTSASATTTFTLTAVPQAVDRWTTTGLATGSTTSYEWSGDGLAVDGYTIAVETATTPSVDLVFPIYFLREE